MREEVLEVPKFAEIIASLAVIGVAGLAANDDLAVRILDAFKRKVETCE